SDLVFLFRFNNQTFTKSKEIWNLDRVNIHDEIDLRSDLFKNFVQLTSIAGNLKINYDLSDYMNPNFNDIIKKQSIFTYRILFYYINNGVYDQYHQTSINLNIDILQQKYYSYNFSNDYIDIQFLIQFLHRLLYPAVKLMMIKIRIYGQNVLNNKENLFVIQTEKKSALNLHDFNKSFGEWNQIFSKK
ncbi:hypothetical protein MXB_3607, partial [Myxobolus squamalis]